MKSIFIILIFSLFIVGCSNNHIDDNYLSNTTTSANNSFLSTNLTNNTSNNYFLEGDELFNSQLKNFTDWMREKKYDERIIKTYNSESKNIYKRKMLTSFFQVRASNPTVEDIKLEDGVALFKLFNPINLTWYDVIPTDSDVKYIAFNESITSQYADYLTQRFGKKFNVIYKRIYLDYNKTFGNNIFEPVLIPKDVYISKMKKRYGNNLEKMSFEQLSEYNKTLNVDTLNISNIVNVINPDYFATKVDDMTQNLTPPCIYNLAVTEYHNRTDLYLLEVRKCSMLMNTFPGFYEMRDEKSYYMTMYFDSITEELGHSFGLIHEMYSVPENETVFFEFAGIMSYYNMFKSPDGPWVSPLVRYALEPKGGYDDDPSKVTLGFGEKYNQVMSWKLDNIT